MKNFQIIKDEKKLKIYWCPLKSAESTIKWKSNVYSKFYVFVSVHLSWEEWDFLDSLNYRDCIFGDLFPPNLVVAVCTVKTIKVLFIIFS